MTAAWNVVSVYSNVGTDFPSLHKAIDDLKSVLEESDGVTKVRVTGELQFRHDFTRPESRSQPISEQPRTDQGSQQSSRVGRHRRTTPKAPVPQRFEDLTGEEHDLDVDEPIIMYCNTRSIQDGTIRDKTVKEEEISVKLPKLQAAQGEDVRHLDKQQSSILPSVSREDMDQADSNGPAPAVQAIRHHAVQDQLVATNDAETPQTVPSNSGTLPAPQRSKSLNPTNLQSIAIPEISRSSLPPKCASSHAPPTSSPRQPTPIQQDTISPEDKPSRRNSRDLSAFTLSELKDKYKSRKLKMIQTFGGSANIPKAHKRQMSQIWDQIQEKEKAEGEATNKPTSVDKGRQVEGRGVAQIREAEGRGQIVVTKKKKKGMYVYSHDSMEERYEDADIPGTGGMSESEVLTLGGGLGSSILGTKKTEGKVPVAVMVHNRN